MSSEESKGDEERRIESVNEELESQDVLGLAADISELRKELEKVNKRVSILERSRQLHLRDKDIKRVSDSGTSGNDDTGLQARQR